MSTYDARGVSAGKEDVHNAIRNIDRGLFPSAFCKVVPDLLAFDSDYCLVMHADGAGTKSSLAYIYWKQTGDISVWEGIAQDAIVMNTDDLLCVGITDNIMLSSTIGRNKRLIPGEVITALIEGNEKFIAKMKKEGIIIHSTGGETADVGDLVRTVIVDSTVVARVKRSDVISNDRISAGDYIVGLASFGQASYEDEYNGGMGSNGLTSARHDVFEKQLMKTFPESFDPLTPAELVYAGSCSLQQPIAINDDKQKTVTAGKLVLSPTRTYAPIIKHILSEIGREDIHGMIHCSGGGQTKILHFLPPSLSVVKDNLFPTPPLFNLIHDQSSTSYEEMYRVFNMGHRFELYVKSKAVAERIIEISKTIYKVDAQVIGRVEERRTGTGATVIERPPLTIRSPHGHFTYSK